MNTNDQLPPVPSMVDETAPRLAAPQRFAPRHYASQHDATQRPALVPTTTEGAIKLAEMMAASALVPQSFQKKPADVLMVVMQSIRWNMDPIAVIQECSVIQGRLMYSGKLCAAIINTRGNLTQRLSYEYEGEGRERTIIVSGQLQGETTPRTIEVILKNVATQAKVWQQQPDQQLMYHGARVWARRHTPELMLGVWAPEEFDNQAEAVANGISIAHPDDYSDGTPERLTKPPPPKHDVSVSKANGLTGASAKLEIADARWREKIEHWMLQVDQIETIKVLDDWISNHSIEASSIPPRHKELQQAIYRKVRLKREELENAALVDQVVHDADEPRPATMADFYDEDEPETTSERAIAMRELKS